MRPLEGVRVLEIAGLGPGPFCGMLLADLGADVVVVERPNAAVARPEYIVNRGKRSIALDLKQPSSVEIVLRLLEKSDALIEGMRPGVMERLGLGPDVCMARRPSLVYGRVTGWGQHGPLVQAAGHDSNYIALSGALWYASPPGVAPVAPPTLVGDVAGGSLYLAIGLLAGIMKARACGHGDVVDAAIVDGTAHMMNLLLGAIGGNPPNFARGANYADGSHWFYNYKCADGGWISLASMEPAFYAEMRRRLGIDQDARFDSQMDSSKWPEQRRILGEIFATRTRAQWCELLEGSDACFAPVNDPREAAIHPHMDSRGVYSTINGILQAAPAPRFQGEATSTWRSGVPKVGEHTEEILRAAGCADEEVADLKRLGAI
jgi:crotonobetainyl-CoA:carnitine CoA-transferase CaiB-like acyl-CoA transferase